jgi:hypothetical protein
MATTKPKKIILKKEKIPLYDNEAPKIPTFPIFPMPVMKAMSAPQKKKATIRNINNDTNGRIRPGVFSFESELDNFNRDLKSNLLRIKPIGNKNVVRINEEIIELFGLLENWM